MDTKKAYVRPVVEKRQKLSEVTQGGSLVVTGAIGG